MRVLFTTWAWPSHYDPMVPLAWAMRAAGHEVRMASQPELLPAMRASGLPVTAIGRDVDVAGAYRAGRELLERNGPPVVSGPPRQKSRRFTDHLADQIDTPELVRGYQLLRDLENEAISTFRALWVNSPLARPWRLSLYGEVAQAMLDDLLTLARSWKPDLIVFDPLTHAGPLAGKLLGIPTVRILFGPDVNAYLGPAGVGEVLDKHGLDDVDLHGDAAIDPCPASLQFINENKPKPRIPVRYLPYSGIAEVPTWLLDPPDRPRICLTWGTTNHRLLGPAARGPSELLDGCAKLVAERDAELVLAIKADQRSLLPDLPANVRVVESAPLDDLLVSCQAIVHQGGAGTMFTALRHGLPQIVLPHLFDAAANGFKIVATGAGQMHAAVGISSADVLAAGHELLDEPGYRASAQRLQREIQAMPSPADAVAELLSVVG